MSDSDRRKYLRIPMEAVLGVETTRSLAMGLDLSQGGIRFSCVGLNVEVGDTLCIDLALEDQTFNVVGTAIRVTELDRMLQEVALAFSEVDPETQQLLGLLEQLLVPDES